MRYLLLGGDPFTLQQLLGHEDRETIRNYMHLDDPQLHAPQRPARPDTAAQVQPRRPRLLLRPPEPAPGLP
ncbi:MAG TPA: hypothetical protein VKJ47_14965 [Candidatus Binatia bacterium]|nr:hypothetical protein [Candidatus Binatia bacterium]